MRTSLEDTVQFLIQFSLNLFIGYDKIAQMLIEKGAKIDEVNEDNNSPLLWATFTGTLYSKESEIGSI